MDTGSQLTVELILKKSAGTIKEIDKKYLLARRSYIPEAEFRRLGIELPETEADAGKAPVAESGNLPEGDGSSSSEGEKKVYSRMNKSELMAEAMERGIDVPEGATNPVIAGLLRESDEKTE